MSWLPKDSPSGLVGAEPALGSQDSFCIVPLVSRLFLSHFTALFVSFFVPILIKFPETASQWS